MFEIGKNPQKKKKKRNCILHTRKDIIKLTRKILRGKIETKTTLLGEKSKIA